MWSCSEVGAKKGDDAGVETLGHDGVGDRVRVTRERNEFVRSSSAKERVGELESVGEEHVVIRGAVHHHERPLELARVREQRRALVRLAVGGLVLRLAGRLERPQGAVIEEHGGGGEALEPLEAALASLLLLSSWEIAYHARWVAPDGLMMSAAAFAILLMARSLNAPDPKWWLRAAALLR